VTVANEPLLVVENFEVTFETRTGPLKAVRGVSLEISRGERLGLVGESGSGKSVLAQSLVRLVPGAQLSGRARLNGEDLMSLTPREFRRVRGQRVGVVFQDPMTALNPVRTIGSQIVEAARHRDLSRKQARVEAIDLLRQLGMPQAADRFDDYPHQFSGGMRQRVVIASALLGQPDLLIADEPTTALDVRLQAQLLDHLWTLSEERGLAVLLISHDLALVGGFAHRVHVMYAGEIRESATPDDLFSNAAHPYTQGLLNSSPVIGAPHATHRLIPIAGSPPTPFAEITGCTFMPRCPHAVDLCLRERPATRYAGGGKGHTAACHLALEFGARSGETPRPARLGTDVLTRDGDIGG
jgi:peptide/nickel transport system ATP-binding protein